MIKPFSRTKLSILPTSHFLWENSEPSTFLENFKNLTQKTQPRKHPEKTLIVGFGFFFIKMHGYIQQPTRLETLLQILFWRSLERNFPLGKAIFPWVVNGWNKLDPNIHSSSSEGLFWNTFNEFYLGLLQK